jgi:hypothetical protein
MLPIIPAELPETITLTAGFLLCIINFICRSGGIGRHKGLKIPRGSNPVPVQVRPPAIF